MFLGIDPTLEYLIMGALGGVLFLLRKLTAGEDIEPMEYVSRPIFGGVAAVLLTVSLGLPNSLTSIFAGYFGIHIFDAMAERAKDMHLRRAARKAEMPRQDDTPVEDDPDEEPVEDLTGGRP